MRAIGVPQRLLAQAWPLIEPQVATALRRGKADQSPADVRGHIERGTMQLWLAWADGEPRPRGVWITELLESARGRYCNIVVLAGRKFETWHPLESYLAQWARENGCVRLTMVGRRGWARRLRCWREAAVTLERQIDGRE
jgi:hypothetical protein